jgi:hypothetical protein
MESVIEIDGVYIMDPPLADLKYSIFNRQQYSFIRFGDEETKTGRVAG